MDKKATINPINKKKKKKNDFKYAVIFIVDREEIGKNPERITKIKPLWINITGQKYLFPLEKDEGEEFDKKYWYYLHY